MAERRFAVCDLPGRGAAMTDGRLSVTAHPASGRVILIGAGGAYRAELDYFATLALSALLSRAADAVTPQLEGKIFEVIGG
jgi:hypothetical protein